MQLAEIVIDNARAVFSQPTSDLLIYDGVL